MKSYTSSYQKLFKATLAATVATGAFVAAVPGVADAATPALKDLDKKQDYYEDVLNLVERGIVKGFPDGTYKPHNSVTRGQAAKILAMTLNLDTKNVKDPGFKDVKKTDEYYGPIAALAQAGIINGYPDNTFGQANTLTRSQMAKIITIGFDLPEEELTDTRFTDVKETDEFAGYVQSLLTNEITKGTTATTFSPANAVSRGQMASFVVRSEKAVANKGTTATVESYTSDSIVLSTGTYALPASLEGLFNTSNEDVLKGAVLNYDLDNDGIVKINSIEIVANGTSTTSAVLDGKNSSFAGNLIVNGDYVTVKDLTVKGNLEIGKEVENSFLGEGITVEGNTIISDKAVATEVAQASADKVYKSLAFTVPVTSTNSTIAASETGAKIEFLNANLGKVSVAKSNAAVQLTGNTVTTGLTLSSNNSLTVGANVTVPQVTVEGSAEVTIDGPGKIEKLNVASANANLTLGSNTTIGNLTLPTGTEAKDVISDYENAKDNIEKIGGDTNPDVTPPSTGGGGGGGSSTPAPTQVSTPDQFKAALENSRVKSIVLKNDITVTGQVVPAAGVTIDGGGNSLIFTESTDTGASTAEGLYIKNSGVTIKNLVIDNVSHGDNLIEIYNNATLENVTVKNGKKAGIYVNNDKENTTITVNFKNITTANNGWGAGIGLLAQKDGGKVIANFSGENKFGEDVAVYSDNTANHATYKGSVTVNGLGNAYSNPENKKDNWGPPKSDEAATAKFLADLAAAESGDGSKEITLSRDVTVNHAIKPAAGVTIDGNEYKLYIANGDSNNEGKTTAEGLYLANNNVTIKNIEVTGTHGDNLIEIYNNATLENVTVTGGKKAGIYVNNDKEDTNITVHFKDITTEGNGWNAGIGLLAQKVGSKVIANFSGTNTFGEDVAIYTDDRTKYFGIYEVNDLNQDYVKVPIGTQDKWAKREKVSSLVKSQDLQLESDTSIWKATFEWNSATGIGLAGIDEVLRNNYTYSKEGTYLRFKVEDSNKKAKIFSEVFSDMILQTNDGPLDSIKGMESGRQYEDWNNIKENGYFTKLNGNESNPYVYYGLVQSGKTNTETRTVNFDKNTKRVINLVLKPNIAMTETYTVTVEVMKQTMNYTAEDEVLGETVFKIQPQPSEEN